MVHYDFGPRLTEDGIEFRLWAPLANTVLLTLDDGPLQPMERSEEGWHRRLEQEAGAGTRYSFLLPDGLLVPDPASRHQPDDVHGASEVVDVTRYGWRSANWTGRPWHEAVIYELHVGTFTQKGTFLAVIERLDHLKQLGVTAIQLMPVSDFPGRYNWGYDGVLPYAPDSSYGRPEDLMALVDAAHDREICVFLDVVYNHFGPDGNYLPAYAPLFTEHHKTPWGNGINYDGANSKFVREFLIQNAIYWIREYKLDGLRLDAVHAIQDDSGQHLLHELADRVREAAGDRHIHLIVENEDNNSDLLSRDDDGKPSKFTAQWNDDIHHVLHIAASAETFGYYQDYTGDTGNLGRALAEGFVFQGEHMPYRGNERGMPSAHLPPTAFVSFIQNHDQIGNRALGDRMIGYVPMEALKAVIATYLLSPQIPMLFMGEEWGAREPFPYFCDFDEELSEKVTNGRREELSRLPGFDADDLLDPAAWATFASGKLDWSRLSGPSSTAMLDFYRVLLDLRRRHVVPLLDGIDKGESTYRATGQAVAVKWILAGGNVLHLVANLSAEAAPIEIHQDGAEVIFATGSYQGSMLAPWTVLWSIRTQ